MAQDRHDKTTVIRAKESVFRPHVKEVLEYKDLIFLLARRNLSVKYKQTVLGPLWLVIMPVISALVSTFVFGGIAGLENQTGGVPYFVFYFSAFTLWAYFSACITDTATTFSGNATLFRKVWFPRAVVPLSDILSELLRFAVQFVLLLIIMLISALAFGAKYSPAWGLLWLLPLILVQSALLALGVGLLLSALTAKYRDLSSLVPLGVDAWKYLTPVVYTASSLTGWVRTFCLVNPMGAGVEAFRYILLGTGGSVEWVFLAIGLAETLVVLGAGLLLFHRVERTFVDTV